MSNDDDDRRGVRADPWVVNLVVILVSIVWAVSFLAPIFRQAYKPAAEINIAFAAVVGGSLGYRILSKEK